MNVVPAAVAVRRARRTTVGGHALSLTATSVRGASLRSLALLDPPRLLALGRVAPWWDDAVGARSLATLATLLGTPTGASRDGTAADHGPAGAPARHAPGRTGGHGPVVGSMGAATSGTAPVPPGRGGPAAAGDQPDPWPTAAPAGARERTGSEARRASGGPGAPGAPAGTPGAPAASAGAEPAAPPDRPSLRRRVATPEGRAGAHVDAPRRERPAGSGAVPDLAPPAVAASGWDPHAQDRRPGGHGSRPGAVPAVAGPGLVPSRGDEEPHVRRPGAGTPRSTAGSAPAVPGSRSSGLEERWTGSSSRRTRLRPSLTRPPSGPPPPRPRSRRTGPTCRRWSPTRWTRCCAARWRSTASRGACRDAPPPHRRPHPAGRDPVARRRPARRRAGSGPPHRRRAHRRRGPRPGRGRPLEGLAARRRRPREHAHHRPRQRGRDRGRRHRRGDGRGRHRLGGRRSSGTPPAAASARPGWARRTSTPPSATSSPTC